MKNGINKWLTIISILLLVANAVTLTLLWNKKGREGPAPLQGQVFEFVTRELNLTQAQQNEYKVLREQHQAAQRLLQDSIRLAKDAFFELLRVPVVNDTVLQAASNKGLLLQQQLEIVTFKHFQKVRMLCTLVQQQKFDEIIKQVLLQMSGPRMRPPGPPPADQAVDTENIPPKAVSKEASNKDRVAPPEDTGMRREGPPPGKWGRRPPPPGDMPPPPPGAERRGDGPPPPPQREGMPPPSKE